MAYRSHTPWPTSEDRVGKLDYQADFQSVLHQQLELFKNLVRSRSTLCNSLQWPIIPSESQNPYRGFLGSTGSMPVTSLAHLPHLPPFLTPLQPTLALTLFRHTRHTRALMCMPSSAWNALPQTPTRPVPSIPHLL